MLVAVRQLAQCTKDALSDGFHRLAYLNSPQFLLRRSAAEHFGVLALPVMRTNQRIK
jgi:hypothetical protein